MDVEEEIAALGVQIIWVLEYTQSYVAGTATTCRQFMDGYGSEVGLCVGDGQTEPEAGTFDSSPFSVYRGFDMIVTRDDMVVQFDSSHGTGDENLTGAELKAEIEAVLAAQ